MPVLSEHPAHGGSTQLLTGGTGSLGLVAARWLAQHGARAVVLASRGGGVSVPWAAEQGAACAVLAARCDSGEPADVRRLLPSIAWSLEPQVRGVWHAAGVLADGMLAQQGAQTLRRVYAPKVHGAGCVHRAWHGSALEGCVLFSSIASLLGGAGQANYSAANGCLDALAAAA